MVAMEKSGRMGAVGLPEPGIQQVPVVEVTDDERAEVFGKVYALCPGNLHRQVADLDLQPRRHLNLILFACHQYSSPDLDTSHATSMAAKGSIIMHVIVASKFTNQPTSLDIAFALSQPARSWTFHR